MNVVEIFRFCIYLRICLCIVGRNEQAHDSASEPRNAPTRPADSAAGKLSCFCLALAAESTGPLLPTKCTAITGMASRAVGEAQRGGNGWCTLPGATPSSVGGLFECGATADGADDKIFCVGNILLNCQQAQHSK